MATSMRHYLIPLLFLFLAGALFVGPDAYAGPLRIALPDSAVVRGDSIVLADLLPVDAPRLLRNAAENVNLGQAPQSGQSRRLSRSIILGALPANGLDDYTFKIPECITLRRAAHLVTRDEVLTAIRQSLAQSQNPDFAMLRPEDVSFDPVALPDSASQLEITGITYDQLIGRACFHLRSKSAPEVRPFYATVQVPNHSSLPRVSARPHPVSARATSASESPILVDPTRLARLHLYSSTTNIFLDVKPLQRGHLGEIIRVRIPSNGRTFRAQVMEGGSLDAVL